MSPSATQTATTNGNATTADSTEKLIKDLDGTDTLPLWAQMAKLNPPEPNPRCVPYIWRFKDVRPYLIRAGQVVSEKQAERRVLMLINPGRETAPYSTDTLYAGLQLVMPNETAPAHRHVAFAMRFIIEGSGGFTAVHGRRIKMQRGDVILTPTWNYHDHGKDGSGPMIWLDGLDLPNFQYFPVHFVQHFQEARYPAEDVDTSDSPLVFPWNKMQAQLDAENGEWASFRYLKTDGREVSLTLGGAAERINAGTKSPQVQETSSSVYHVVSGSGFSQIGGQKIVWSQSDTFCIPSWTKYQHFADDSSSAYLYRFDDQPMIKALGFYRTAGMDVESLIS